MSIKRIETMSGSDIMRLIDNSENCSHCDNCPLKDDDEHCNFGCGSCLSSIINWLYEEVDEDETNDEDEFNTVLNMSIVAASIHDLIRTAVELSGINMSAFEFAQMIAERIHEEEDDE